MTLPFVWTTDGTSKAVGAVEPGGEFNRRPTDADHGRGPVVKLEQQAREHAFNAA
jgi:hypothetical protein